MTWLCAAASVAAIVSLCPPPAALGQEASNPAEAVAGLWSYQTLKPAKGTVSRLNGYFLFKDGYFLQEARNDGEPFDQQAVQAHAGTYTVGDTVRLAAEVQLGVRPGRTPPVTSTPGRTHQITPVRDDDHLTLTFGSGTVQTFRRTGPGKGEVILLEGGALALVDGRFIIVAEHAGGQVVGAGQAERLGSTLVLAAERWMTARDGRVRYERDVRKHAALEAGELRLPDGQAFRVRRAGAGGR